MESKLPQKFGTPDIVIAALFAVLLGCTGFFLASQEETPLVALIALGLGMIILIATLVRPRAKVNVAFYILFTGLLILSYSLLIRGIADQLNPQDGWTIVNGEPKKVMQMNWLWGGLAYILTPLTIAWYDRRKSRNRKLETVLCAGFVLVAAGICMYWVLF